MPEYPPNAKNILAMSSISSFELADSWIKEAKEDAPYENTPYLLWDRGEKVEVQMLSHPEIAKKIIEYTKSLVEISNEKYIPYLSRT